MSLLSLSLFAAFAAAQPPAVARSTSAITVVHPAEGELLSGAEGEFVLGSVSDPDGLFRINGQTVAVRQNGAYLAWVPVQPGTFTLRCSLTLSDKTTAYYERAIFVVPPLSALPAKPLAIDADSLIPRNNQELRPGDWLLARMHASPGQKARFRLKDHPWQPMRAVNSSLYEGAALVGPGEELQASPVEFQLGSGWSSVGAKSQGLVTLNSAAPAVAVARGQDFVGVKTGPGEGELFHALTGARFLTAGRANNETKVALSGGLAGWVETKNLDFLPPGAQPPHAVSDAVSVKAGEGSTTVRISLADRVPFTIEEAADLKSLVVRLHYAVSHTNWIIYDAADPLVDEVRLRQEAAELLAVTIRLKPGKTLWGYHASYDGTSVKVELRAPPRLAEAPASPLKGLRVFLDAGHMPSAPGAIGALGTREMDVNFQIAKAVEARLQGLGAVPILSRSSGDEEVGLSERPRLAWEKKADLFVSIHNNSFPDGTNPFKSAHGYSIFYYQPRSLELARKVYNAYARLVPIPGEELRFGNLRVLRATEMPAILTESAYLSLPEQEELLNGSRFRAKLAEAIVEGLRAYLDELAPPKKAREKAR